MTAWESALASLAVASGHPELVDAPWLPTGMSNGGQMSYGLNALRPERVIGFSANKGGFYNSDRPSLLALATPVILRAGGGETDTQLRRENIRSLFDLHRPRGARWAWVEEENSPHEIGDSMELILPFLAEVATTRYPAESSSLDGSPALLPLAESTGWLAATESFRNG
ncbi:MAG: hypothetical protein J6386_22705 [Candidatus Synoicihabitans palmerolidicus]|nr:hypothetical protein [Candidatus Synoicihabitans palmerolidicus]